MTPQNLQKKASATSSKSMRTLLALIVIVMSVSVPIHATAQVTGATLSGTLTDSSGAVLPKAKVVIKNIATGVTTTVTTNNEGFYNSSNLLPGSYTMTVSAPGFSTAVRTGITLEVGGNQVLNIPVSIGNNIETVEVTSAAPDVELASSTLGTVVGRQAVVDLPLNGRSWTDLAALEPGVSPSTTQYALDNLSDASGRSYRGSGASSTIGGARPAMNNYRLDGISINDYTNGPPSNVIGETAGVDAIQEFSVLTTNYSAEYGDTSGGVINAVTRSGTDKFHGSAYEFIRNSALDAKNYFDGAKIPPFRRNQFGASLGGPIIKDRTLFFVNYEGLSQFKSLTIVNVVPSAAARAGHFCTAPSTPTACTASNVAVSSAAQTYLPFFPLPNAGLLPTGNGDTGYFNFAAPEVASDNFFTAKIDHKISEKDSLTGTFLIDRGPFTLPDPLNLEVLGFSDNRQVYSLAETHVFSSNLVNNARGGAFREYSTAVSFISAINPLVNDTTLGYLPGLTATQVKISGIAPFAGGKGGYGYTSWGFTTYQFSDDASLVHGAHTFKLGFAFERQQDNFNPQSSGAIWNFGSFSNFLTNNPSSFTGQTVNSVSPERGLRDAIIGGYIQDDWRFRKNLVFNIGLRYEMLTNPTEVHGYWAALSSLTDATPRVGNPFFKSNPTLLDFDPRVGFVWDPFHKGNSSIRGGFGMFDSEPLISEFPRSISGVAPFSFTGTTSSPPQGSFYNGIASSLSPTSAVALYLQPNPRRPYVMQWNLSVQRELAPTLTATVTYLGSSGVHLPYDTGAANAVTAVQTSAGLLYPAPIGSGTRLNKNFGQILAISEIAHASYDALGVRVNKRMSHGFQVEGSYTWAKSIDNSSSQNSTGDFSNTLIQSLFYLPSASRGLSDFNVSQNVVINAIWQTPSAKSLSKVAKWFTDGYQMAAIYRSSGGTPFTPTFGSGGSAPGVQSGSNVSAFPDRLKGPGCQNATNPQSPGGYIKLNCFTLPTAPSMDFWTANCDHTTKTYGSPTAIEPYPICLNLQGNAGRNSLIGPGLSNLDFSLFKNNKVSEWLNVQFRAEVFNIMNRPNFAVPTYRTNTDLYNSAGVPAGTAGLLTSTATASRQIQFALKLIW